MIFLYYIYVYTKFDNNQFSSSRDYVLCLIKMGTHTKQTDRRKLFSYSTSQDYAQKAKMLKSLQFPSIYTIFLHHMMHLETISHRCVRQLEKPATSRLSTANASSSAHFSNGRSAAAQNTHNEWRLRLVFFARKELLKFYRYQSVGAIARVRITHLYALFMDGPAGCGISVCESGRNRVSKVNAWKQNSRLWVKL